MALIERLWSICKQVYQDHRMCTTPLVFEALIFLKINQQYWNQQTVKEAMNLRFSSYVDKSLMEDNEEEESSN